MKRSHQIHPSELPTFKPDLPKVQKASTPQTPADDVGLSSVQPVLWKHIPIRSIHIEHIEHFQIIVTQGKKENEKKQKRKSLPFCAVLMRPIVRQNGVNYQGNVRATQQANSKMSKDTAK